MILEKKISQNCNLILFISELYGKNSKNWDT